MRMKSIVTYAALLFAGSSLAAAELLAYKAENWKPEMRALLGTQTVWLRPGWAQRFNVDPPPGLQSTWGEIQVLTSLKPERSANAENIALEDAYVGNRYFQFLRIGRFSHPRTYQLVDSVVDEAAIVVMHFKDRFNRARPWEYEPALNPIIAPPGHPAYPSGHSTQAHSVSMVLARVVPEDADALQALAFEIARNREVGGVHYASDSTAGRQLAAQIVAELFLDQDFDALIERARVEMAGG